MKFKFEKLMFKDLITLLLIIISIIGLFEEYNRFNFILSGIGLGYALCMIMHKLEFNLTIKKGSVIDIIRKLR